MVESAIKNRCQSVYLEMDTEHIHTEVIPAAGIITDAALIGQDWYNGDCKLNCVNGKNLLLTIQHKPHDKNRNRRHRTHALV